MPYRTSQAHEPKPITGACAFCAKPAPYRLGSFWLCVSHASLSPEAAQLDRAALALCRAAATVAGYTAEIDGEDDETR